MPEVSGLQGDGLPVLLQLREEISRRLLEENEIDKILWFAFSESNDSASIRTYVKHSFLDASSGNCAQYFSSPDAYARHQISL